MSSAMAGPICAPAIQQMNSNGISASLSGRDNFTRNNLTPPAMLGQVSNTPCMSNELQRLQGQFSGMLRGGVAGVGASIGMTGSPISSIMNSAFKSDFQVFNSSAMSIPKMLNFQSLASNTLGSLLGSLGSSLGLSSVFSSQMCGIMLDMVLKYIQCQNPIKFPNLSDLFGKLDLNLPGGCAGQALRTGIYGAARTDAVKGLSQSITRGANGTYSMSPMQ